MKRFNYDAICLSFFILGLINLNTIQTTSAQQTPNMSHVVREMAQEHPEAMRAAFNGHPDYDTIEGREFQDRVIQKLHSIDPQFGYVERYVGGNPDRVIIAADILSYFKGSGNAQSASETTLTIVDFIVGAGPPKPWWSVLDQTTEVHNAGYKWVYPRPGSPNYGYDPNHPGPVVGEGTGINKEQQTPNMSHVVREMAQEHPEAMRAAFNGHPDYDTIEGREFQDRVIQKLHSIDPQFGYVERYVGGNPDRVIIAADVLSYFKGSGNAQSASETTLTIVDFIVGAGPPKPWWSVLDRTTEVHNAGYKWVYPRPGSPNYGYDPNHPGPVVGEGN